LICLKHNSKIRFGVSNDEFKKGTNIDFEIFETEKLMLESGRIPFVFFVFQVLFPTIPFTKRSLPMDDTDRE